MIAATQITAAPKSRNMGQSLKAPSDCSPGAAAGFEVLFSSDSLFSGSLILASEEGSSETALLSSDMEDSSGWEDDGSEVGWLLVPEETLG